MKTIKNVTRNPDRTYKVVYQDNSEVITDYNSEIKDWQTQGNNTGFVAKTIEEKRRSWVVSPAQIRLALLQMGLLDAVQQIADSDPAASVVWEYATQIKRNNDLIDALGGEGFTPEQIDDIFIYAMGIQI